MTISSRQKQIYAVHNPTGTAYSFLLPVFTSTGGDNQLYVQHIDFDDTVAKFEPLSEEYLLKGVQNSDIVELGKPALHAFERSQGDLLVGTRADLAVDLIQLLGQPLNLAPLLQVQIADFCKHPRFIRASVQSAYTQLKNVSKFSADHWRDYILLSSRVRMSLMRSAIAGGLAHRLSDDWWNSAHLFISHDRPVLRLQSEALQLFSSFPSWRKRLQLELAVYLSAFIDYPTEIDVVQTIGDAETQMPPISDRLQHGSSAAGHGPSRKTARFDWLLCDFGPRSERIARSLSRGDRIATLRQFGEPSPQLIRGAIAENRELPVDASPAREPRALVIFDASPHEFERAQEFIRKIPKELKVDVAAIYTTQDGTPRISASAISDLDGVASTFILPASKLPTTSADKASSVTDLVRQLIETLEHCQDEKQIVPGGVSVFSSASTRQGIRGVDKAITVATAAGANPWLPPSTWDQATLMISSVGTPSSVDQLEMTLNKCLLREGRPPIRLQSTWKRRRFIAGGVVGAKAAIMFHSRGEQMPGENSIVDAAQTVLTSLGLSTSASRKTTFGDVFEVSGENSDSITVISPTAPSWRSSLPHQSERWISLVDSAKSQVAEINQPDWETVPPLKFSDFFFLRDTEDLHLAAKIIAALSQPKQQWAALLNKTLTRELKGALVEAGSPYDIRSLFSDVYSSAEIENVDVQIDGIQSRKRWHATISGRMTVDMKTKIDNEAAPANESRRISYIVEIGPDGCNPVHMSLL